MMFPFREGRGIRHPLARIRRPITRLLVTWERGISLLATTTKFVGVLNEL